ncbi:hypothetical protein FRC02_011667 [Tulasnella sp. 418]|nr:hypothetical protein FRC02_011667 [Tulasnella sp. 418]
MQTLKRRGQAKSANPLPSKGRDASSSSDPHSPSSPPPPLEPRPAARLSVRRSWQDASILISGTMLSLQRRTSTADLSDFLRDTGPPPTLPPPSTPSHLSASPSTLKTRLFSQRLKGKDAKSLKRLTSDTFTPAGVQALNKALHDIPPPNTEPKVFANG